VRFHCFSANAVNVSLHTSFSQRIYLFIYYFSSARRSFFTFCWCLFYCICRRVCTELRFPYVQSAMDAHVSFSQSPFEFPSGLLRDWEKSARWLTCNGKHTFSSPVLLFVNKFAQVVICFHSLPHEWISDLDIAAHYNYCHVNNRQNSVTSKFVQRKVFNWIFVCIILWSFKRG
jgi:hypothetical protein